MAASVIDSYQVIGSTSSTNSITLTLTNAVAAGDVIILATGRNASATNVGVSSITGQGAGNSWTLNAAVSTRANSIENNISYCPVVNAISANTDLTITLNSAVTRKVAVAAVFHGIDDTHETTSGTYTGAGNTSNNSNGSGTVHTATATGAITTQPQIVVGVLSVASGNTMSENDTAIQEVQTATGTTDRGLSMQWRTTTTLSTKTSTGTSSASEGWAATLLTFPVLADTNVLPSDVVVSGAKKSVVGGTVVVGGVKKTIASVKVIVGGVKKTVV